MDLENYDHYWKVEDVRRHFDELEVECDPPCHPIIVSRDFKLGEYINNMVKQSFDGLKEGNPPCRPNSGAGGTYLIPGPNENQTTSDMMEKTNNNIHADQKAQKYVSVFKPQNEEPNEEYYIPKPQTRPNRPKRDKGISMTHQGLKEGTMAGGGAPRELAAYLLDHPQDCRREGLEGEVTGFAGVPPTLIVHCINKNFNYAKKFNKEENKTINTGKEYEYKIENYKVGSLQKFMKNGGDCKKKNKDDVDISNAPAEEVHKISLLDIRFANVDRHGGNILVRKVKDAEIETTKTLLIPIDHGSCFPKTFAVQDFVWLEWKQAKVPYNEVFKQYINSLDAEKDIALLKRHKFLMSHKSIRTFRISTMLLKKGVNKGLTPFDIGELMCRERVKTKQKKPLIEKIVGDAIKVLTDRLARNFELPGLSLVASREVVTKTIVATVVSTLPNSSNPVKEILSTDFDEQKQKQKFLFSLAGSDE